MNKNASIVAVALLAASLTGCSSFKQGYDKGFKENFKTSFTKSCAKTPNMNDFCGCTADAVLAKYTPEQLTAMKDDDTAAAVRDAARTCQSKLKNG